MRLKALEMASVAAIVLATRSEGLYTELPTDLTEVDVIIAGGESILIILQWADSHFERRRHCGQHRRLTTR